MRRIPTARLILGVAILLAAVLLLPPACYWWHLAHQRSVQSQIAALPGVACEGDDKHWLSEWLPDSWSDQLPDESLNVQADSYESIDELMRLTAQTDTIHTLTLWNGSDFQDPYWQLVVQQNRLRTLKLVNLPLTDMQATDLVSHRELHTLEIVGAPLTDGALAWLGKLPALENLVLHNTSIGLESIDTFARLHPSVRIGWVPPISSVEESHIKVLSKCGIRVYRSAPYNRIARSPSWRLHVSQDVAYSPEAVASLQGLGGKIASISFVDGVSPECLDFAYRLPDLTYITIPSGPASMNDVDALAGIASIEHIDFHNDMFSLEDRRELVERWGNKVPAFVPLMPPCD